MKITIDKIVGRKNYRFELEGKSIEECYSQAAIIDLLPSRCGVCGSEDLSLTYRNPNNFSYPGVRCNDCTASATIHQKKDKSEFYIDKMAKYVPRNQEVPERDISQEYVEAPTPVQQVFPNTKPMGRPQTANAYGGQVGPSAFK